ncbi:MAG: IreB family regulatory phosphoprotein [Tissierellia bacterium]|nr:IreB family regulatory phosphoprotein [Tissierellia bacterium]
MENNDKTQKFTLPKEEKETAKEIILEVYDSLMKKGYDPINQIIGYLLSGDPTYITSFNDARSTIVRLERDELMEEILVNYLKNLGAY